MKREWSSSFSLDFIYLFLVFFFRSTTLSFFAREEFAHIVSKKCNGSSPSNYAILPNR